MGPYCNRQVCNQHTNVQQINKEQYWTCKYRTSLDIENLPLKTYSADFVYTVRASTFEQHNKTLSAYSSRISSLGGYNACTLS